MQNMKLKWTMMMLMMAVEEDKNEEEDADSKQEEDELYDLCISDILHEKLHKYRKKQK